MRGVVKMQVTVGAMLLLLAAVGCGGSGSGDSGGSTTDTTAATSTSEAGTSERLTDAQWADYQTSRTALRKANTAANATMAKCSVNATNQDIPKTQACVGDTFTTLADATGNMSDTLNGFVGTVSNPCADSLNQVLNYVGTFQASAVQMQRTIDSSTLAGYPAASQNLELALTSGKQEAKSFERDCAPA